MLHCGKRAIALGLRRVERLFEARKLIGKRRQPVGPDQPLGGRGPGTFRDKPVPPPHPAAAGHQPLPDRQHLARVLLGHADLA